MTQKPLFPAKFALPAAICAAAVFSCSKPAPDPLPQAKGCMLSSEPVVCSPDIQRLQLETRCVRADFKSIEASTVGPVPSGPGVTDENRTIDLFENPASGESRKSNAYSVELGSSAYGVMFRGVEAAVPELPYVSFTGPDGMEGGTKTFVCRDSGK